MATVGVIGAGSFGITLARLLAQNHDVLLYSRRKAFTEEINQSHLWKQYKLDEKIVATSDLEQITNSCKVIFPVVPSASFRELMRQMAPLLTPAHFIIHATKGLDLSERKHEFESYRELLTTMSQVIEEETDVVRIGCIAGPNLATEILDGQPAAAVVASKFQEVIEIGKKLLSNEQFFIFSSKDILGVELSGAYKNIIAVGAGILHGHGYGQNMQSILITRGLREMIVLGKALGTNEISFFGVAGIGDLIATCTSKNSRNFSFGSRLAKGEVMEDIIASSEVVEGVRTLELIQKLSAEMKLFLPITNVIHRIVYKNLPVEKAITYLMKLQVDEETSFDSY